ncbi:MAG: helix-turn-helix domain-containing protein [Erysipelotrichales bacterium]|nr:helix-turn-helix domain-containing protein [Erysipelotrichales bacterium]
MSYVNTNELGKWLRQFRIDNDGISKKEMVKKLKLSYTALSMMETGERTIPEDFVEKMIKAYKLTEKQQKQLKQAIKDSKSIVSLNLGKDDSSTKRHALFTFLRSYDDLSDSTMEKIDALVRMNYEVKQELENECIFDFTYNNMKDCVISFAKLVSDNFPMDVSHSAFDIMLDLKNFIDEPIDLFLDNATKQCMNLFKKYETSEEVNDYVKSLILNFKQYIRQLQRLRQVYVEKKKYSNKK